MDKITFENYYQTGVCEDCIDNFIFFKDSINKYINGDKKYFKWTILSLYMFLQELFILHLKHCAFHEIKGNTSHKINDINYKFELYTGMEPYKIDKNKVYLHYSLMGINNRANVCKQLDNEGVKITEAELSNIINQIHKSSEFSELFKKVISYDKNGIWFSASNNILNDERFKKAKDDLVYLRNEFIHMGSDSWWIDYNKFYEIIPDCLDFSVFIIENSRNYKFTYETKFKEQVLPTMKNILEKIMTLKNKNL